MDRLLMGNSRRFASWVALACVVLAGFGTEAATSKNFWSFESGQVRPLALSADGSLLAAVNTPDNRLELFDVDAAGLTPRWSVPVGMEPVSVALWGTQAWVVNHLSDSVSIVDLAATPPRVARTLLLADEPRDIVFAGPGGNHAYITTARRGQNSGVDPRLLDPGVGRALVYVYDATALGSSLEGDPLEILGDAPVTGGPALSDPDVLFGDTPRALAVTADGHTVYAAVFHSGNQTTTISEQFIAGFNAAVPPLLAIPPSEPTTNALGEPAPSVGTIVGFAPQTSLWVDGEGRGFNLFMRMNLPDLDVFEIDASVSPPVVTRSFAGVGTILFNMAINPANDKLYVSNTDANNLERFEGPGTFCATLPSGTCRSLRGHLHESHVTVIDPGASSVVPRHLNTHLVPYSPAFDTPADAARSLAIPLGMAVSSDGATLYLAAMGSNKIGVLPTGPLEAGSYTPSASDHIPLSEGGPTGLVLDEARSRLYVLTRFGNSITVVDISTPPGTELAPIVPLSHDPEPAIVSTGRPFLYDASLTSSNGEAACASCHVFSQFDSMAWNLGDPDGAVVPNPNPFVPGTLIDPNPTIHPMKGPMTTQALRGLTNHGPMHWRGDRTGGTQGGDPLSEFEAFMEFNVAFPGLLGRTTELDPGEMMEFTNFMLEVEYPPNPIRNLDNSDTCDQAHGRALFTGVVDPNDPCTTDVVLGVDANDGIGPCATCHTLDEPNGFFGSGGLTSFEGETQEFKVPHLRNMYQKVGMFGLPLISSLLPSEQNTAFGPQIRGFGFLHDGGIDTLLNFVRAPAFQFSGSAAHQETKRLHIVELMLANPSTLAPIVAQQTTLTSTNGGVVGGRIDLLNARAAASECDLVVKGTIEGEARGWLRVGPDAFESDIDPAVPALEPILSDAALRALVDDPGESLTYTCAPPGSGPRMAWDRDLDGRRDGEECGDANGDGVLGPGDPRNVRLALAGLTPLGAARKCNVVGAADLGDSDGDGVPNDCRIDDLVTLARELAGLPGISQDCEPATL